MECSRICDWLSGASLGAEGRRLSRNTTVSQRVLRCTASAGSTSNSGTCAGDALGVYEVMESTGLPYPCAAVRRRRCMRTHLRPRLPTDHRMEHVPHDKRAFLPSYILEIAVTEYPFYSIPLTPTDQGHSILGQRGHECACDVASIRFDGPFRGAISDPSKWVANSTQLANNNQRNWLVHYDGRSPTFSNTTPERIRVFHRRGAQSFLTSRICWI
ncbi:hypothetical protein JB92DRAFT_3068243 [Gautieria morchelliformis]|nr:hypothetical protein JB92DRAFT_3068243 [Gautieria morchelliformis]